MGRRGPAPTPTKILKLTGSRLAEGRSDEPQPSAKPPQCPDWLCDEARGKWAELQPELSRLGVLTIVDGDVLAAYCTAYAEWKWATQTLYAEGRTTMVGGEPVTMPAEEGKPERIGWCGGQLQPHPAVAQQRSAWKALKEFAALLGLDPSSRSRLHVEKPKAQAGGVAARKRG